MTSLPSTLSRFAAFALLAAFAHPLLAQTRYIADDLGPVGSSIPVDPMGVFGINASGQVAAHNSVAGSGVYSAILYSNFTATNLGALPGDPSSQAGAINESAMIVGLSGTLGTAGPLLTAQKIYLYNNGALQNLGGVAPSVFGINNAGQIVGNSSGHAFLYSAGAFRDLGTLGGNSSRATAINASGQVVGWATLATSTDRHAFLHNGTAMRDLGTLGGATSQAQGINAAGQIVGLSLTAAGETHAFLYKDNVMTDLGLPSGWSETRAYGINTSNQIIGWGRLNNAPRPFLFANGAFVDLTALIPARASGTDGFSSVAYATAINDAGQITGYGTYVANNVSSLHVFRLTPIPTLYPAAITASPNSTVRFTASSTLSAATYQWSRNGTAIGGATSASLILPGVSAAQAGIYTCTVSNAHARVTTAASTLAIDAVRPPGRIVNLAIRTAAGTDAQTLIVGLAIGGAGTSGTKPVLLRATGPALAAFGVSGTLADPKLELYSGTAKLVENDNWSGNAQIIAIGTQVGAFGLTDLAGKDAALYRPALASGGYTVQVSGVGGTTGVALAEIYDATPVTDFSDATPRLINVSARAQVGTGNDVLIAGFVVAGSTAKTVLIRAVGPTLGNFGVAGTLADPQLQLFQNSTVIATNDNWGGEAQLSTTGTSVGAFALTDPASKDAVLLVTLPPGSYTAQVSGVGNTTGVALVEIYEVP